MLFAGLAVTFGGQWANAQQAANPQQLGEASHEMPKTAAAIGMFARGDGTFVADGHGFHADFDGRGATLQVADATRPHVPQLTLRLVDWGRTEGTTRPIAVTDRDVTRVGADTVHYAHPGITERYQLTPTGFEQSFVLQSRPAGSGDLVLGIAAHSPTLQSPARTAAQQTLEFCANGVPEVRYGEAVAFSRSHAHVEAGRVPVATRYDGAGRIELIVPGAFLDRATYPVVVDPGVGPVQTAGGTTWADVEPDVCYDPRTDIYLCVWERRLSTNDRRIRAIRYRRDGTFLGGVINLTGSGFHRTPTVAYLGTSSQSFSGFYVAWASSTGLQGRRIDSATGNFAGGTQQLTTVSLGTRDLRPSLSTRNSTVLIAWDRTPLGASNPSQILIRRAVLPALPSTSVTLGSEHTIESASSGYVQRVRLPRSHILTGGAELRLCWERFFSFPAPGDFDVRTARVVIGSQSLAFIQSPSGLGGASGIGQNERSPDIAQIDDLFQPKGLIVWEDDADVRGHRYDATGLVGLPFDIRATSDRETEPAVGAGSTEFSVGYLSAPSSNPSAQDVYGARLDADGNVLAAHRPIEVINGPLQRSLRASSVVDTAGASNEPNGVLFGWLLESNSFGVIEDVRTRMFEPVTGTVFPFGLACPGPGGTLPEIDVASPPYPGNYDFAITLDNAPPNTLAALLVGDQLATIPVPGAPGCQLYMGLPLLLALPVVTSATGQASVSVPIPTTAGPGIVLACQWGVYTPGWNAFGWIASHDLDLSWQQ